MKLGLGTVQFGLDYGVSNTQGITPLNEVCRILSLAAQSGLRIIDTAATYGTSETVLGKALTDDHHFKIVTKTPVFSKSTITGADADQVEDIFYRSLSNLRAPAVYGLLVHHATDVLSAGGTLIFDRLHQMKNRGLIEKIGVSVYAADEIDRLMDSVMIDIIQLPVNILDQRLIQSGHLQKLKKAQIEIHARSVFLQGVLLMKPESLGSCFDSIRNHLKKYHHTIKRMGISAVEAALGFVINIQEVDTVLCGVNTCRPLQELISAAATSGLPAEHYTAFALTDPNILNPSKWNKAPTA